MREGGTEGGNLYSLSAPALALKQRAISNWAFLWKADILRRAFLKARCLQQFPQKKNQEQLQPLAESEAEAKMNLDFLLLCNGKAFPLCISLKSFTEFHMVLSLLLKSEWYEIFLILINPEIWVNKVCGVPGNQKLKPMTSPSCKSSKPAGFPGMLGLISERCGKSKARKTKEQVCLT